MNRFISFFVYKIKWLHSISVIKYLYYNYFCKNIHREEKSFLIPYNGAVIDIHRTSIIYISGGNLQIGANRFRNSRAETRIRMGRNAKWRCNNGCIMNYGSTIEVNEGGSFSNDFVYINTGSVILADNNIRLGNDIWIGRNCHIYDSDFHSMLYEDGSVRNHPRPVTIGDHVWVTNNVMILKGVTIEGNNVISPYTVVKRDVPFGAAVSNGTQQAITSDHVIWSKKKPD